MKVLIISANRENINMAAFPLGASCVAEAARAAGHDVRLLDFMAERKPMSALVRTVVNFEPDVIGVSIRNIDAQNAQEPELLIEDAKDAIFECRQHSGAPVILGGAGFSIFPKSALAYCQGTAGIVGEGEVVFPKCLNEIENRGEPYLLPGVVTFGFPDIPERHFEAGLDSLPLPDYSAWENMPDRHTLWLPVQSRRGCPLDCTYCSTAAIEGNAIRKRSPGSVVEILKRGVSAGFRNFFFTDNTFNLPPSYAAELCRAILAAQLEIRWRCIIYPNKVDPELAALMARAGCVEVSLGFESGVETILENMNKKFGHEDVRLVSETFKSNGIRRMGFLLLGGPGETKQTVSQSIAFAESLDLDLVRLTPGIRIYPDTALAKTAAEYGYIDPADDLLRPKFYIENEIKDWLGEEVKMLAASRPNWIV